MKSKPGHIQINIDPKNLSFYNGFLEFMGWSVLYKDEETLGMKGDNEANLWFVKNLKDVNNDYDGVGMNHLAIAVSKQIEVDQAAEYLKSQAVAALFDTPRHRPEFREDPLETYYQVMFESPDHILLEVVYSGPKDN